MGEIAAGVVTVAVTVLAAVSTGERVVEAVPEAVVVLAAIVEGMSGTLVGDAASSESENKGDAEAAGRVGMACSVLLGVP